MYVIYNKRRGTYYKRNMSKGFHFVTDIEEANKIWYKIDAKRILLSMKKLRDKEYIEIIKL